MRGFWRWALLLVVSALALELFFLARIAVMVAVDPQSTTFQRSEAWRVATEKGSLRWRQQWVPYVQIADPLKRAVIASEDSEFSYHDGVDWEAIEKSVGEKQQGRKRRPPSARSSAPPARASGRPRSLAAPPSRSNWPRTSSSRASGRCCARARNLC